MYLSQPVSKEDIEAVRELFLEYARWLGFDLRFQGFSDELVRLPGEYAPPSGRLFLVSESDQWAGCVGLRPLEIGICEMKRLYVRPAFRGCGIGRKLALAVIDAARHVGYARVRLDTLGSMKEAITLYESLGFQEVPPYCFNPIDGARYFELLLG